MSLRLVTVFLGILFLLASCNRNSCINNNPVFDKHEIDSKEYVEELIKQVKLIGEENLDYWFESYKVKDDKEYILVNIQHTDLCTKGLFLVENWKELEPIRKTEGKGYRGAQLKGFTFEYAHYEDQTELVFVKLDKIVD